MDNGKVIEIKEILLPLSEGGKPVRKAFRLWVQHDGHRIAAEECCVFVPPYDANRREGPTLGEQISWEAGFVYFDNDRLSIPKIGHASEPPSVN